MADALIDRGAVSKAGHALFRSAKSLDDSERRHAPEFTFGNAGTKGIEPHIVGQAFVPFVGFLVAAFFTSLALSAAHVSASLP